MVCFRNIRDNDQQSDVPMPIRELDCWNNHSVLNLQYEQQIIYSVGCRSTSSPHHGIVSHSHYTQLHSPARKGITVCPIIKGSELTRHFTIYTLKELQVYTQLIVYSNQHELLRWAWTTCSEELPFHGSLRPSHPVLCSGA